MKSIEKNDKITIDIDAISSMGSGIGRLDGMAIFVDGAVTGDKIVAHIIKVSKNYAIGKLHQILEKSKDRIESDCSVSTRCGGCSLRSMSYEAELEYKSEKIGDAIERIGKITTDILPIIGAKVTNRYRNKGQYPVSKENGVVSIGFYASKSHRVIDCNDCLLSPDEFSKGVKAFRLWIIENNISVYDEKTGKGLLRHLYFRKGFGTNEIMACAVINGHNVPQQERLVELLREAVPNLKSIVANVNTKDTNVVLGKQCFNLWGQDYIEDTLCGLNFKISPNSFYQVNHEQTEVLYSLANDFAHLTGSETVLDIYCGSGTIALTMAKNCETVYGIEIISDAVENAKENAKQNNIENAHFLCGDAFQGTALLRKSGVQPDVIVVDPPRKGCEKELIEAISTIGCDRIVYVSCDPATLARDLAIFASYGYVTKKVAPVDLFPRTIHVETVCLLSKLKSDHHI